MEVGFIAGFLDSISLLIVYLLILQLSVDNLGTVTIRGATLCQRQGERERNVLMKVFFDVNCPDELYITADSSGQSLR